MGAVDSQEPGSGSSGREGREVPYLELLAHGLSSVDFHQELHDLGIGAEDPALHEQASEMARRIQAAMERHARREIELTALFETARDLTRLRDVDEVLAAIVRRARQILVTDVAYLALLDPSRKDTYMKVTSGTTSETIGRTRLGVGVGLGGRVVSEKGPFATADYWRDERFTHTEEVDTATREEGLVAILGVPLLVDDQVVGVLYVGDRRVRDYSPDNIALLASFGNLSAVALDSAQALERAERAAVERAASSQLATERADALSRQEAAHRRLMAALLDEGEIPDLGAVLSELVDRPLKILDAQHRTLWCSLGDDQSLASARDIGAGRLQDARGQRWTIVSAGGDNTSAASVAVAAEVIPPEQRRILESGAVAVSLVSVFSHLAEEASERTRSELLTDLLSGLVDRNAETLARRARRVGIDLSSPHVLLVVRLADVERRPVVKALRDWVRARGGALVEHAGNVVLLVPSLPGERAGACAELAAERLRSGGVLAAVGASGPASGPRPIAALYDEADRCAHLIFALESRTRGAELDDLGVFGIIGVPEAAARAAEFARRTLGPLVDHDTRRATSLLPTLTAYLACGRSRSAAAERLHVHVNTVGARLDRITELLGDDWMSPERLVGVQLATQLLPLLEL